ncbi:MAG: hypothetical protein Udaeo2_02420 [Candidatus Udaeobacter sp.]|nr:MAG: hypothetical protein Udaeo2_02420 [Candidatus Udaeobacter sp.]
MFVNVNIRGRIRFTQGLDARSGCIPGSACLLRLAQWWIGVSKGDGGSQRVEDNAFHLHL